MKKVEKVEVLKNKFLALDVAEQTASNLYKLNIELEFSHLVYNQVRKDLNLTKCAKKEPTEFEKNKQAVNNFFTNYNYCKQDKSGSSLICLRASIQEVKARIEAGMEFKYTKALEIATEWVEFNADRITKVEGILANPAKKYFYQKNGWL